MQTLAVIDYGSSNLRSVSKALEYVADADTRILVSDKAKEILAADKIVFPGQGAMGQCMQALAEKDLQGLIAESIAEKPFLGICLGLQSLMDFSEENGGTDGLGIVSGKVRRFQHKLMDEAGNTLKVPHMGWNRVHQQHAHPLWSGIENGERFYFVHSYYVEPVRREDCAALSDYGLDFTSAIARDNFFATQFHPEKSQQAGLRLLSNFLDWRPF
ncbi:MAG: imidazole glycerol phosphate synthase subunit HisH [Gammaproteobacteria bacterium]|nr:imidazole glycerol phosphate synthase subunit HisH [Gammaproteobacteria bacterium]